ncbi:DMT family transporter [Paenibacillus sp. 481]|uniref:DMT family transporter n=1 Tax=Paenibacillus sp. 481 TaxID=2835869 RepID=UPI001E644344|nr:multidrug efflux SMR transporter [Paenibacillus sp. 481]UHA73641.1 multidrug efflux SMR transporter [Paenibacillus sp. 481]
MKGYWYLSGAIAFELLGSSMLKLSDGFTHLLPSIGVLIGFGTTFYLLSLCMRTIPLSLAYAIWAGVGTALTALIGIFIWGEPFSMMTLLGLVLIIGGVTLLNASTSNRTSSDQEQAQSA